ncbi:MAG: class I adenylate-forming enzyme family protein [Novosphingobium sp.]|nr:class I adenylate-forming enzyme family protein [Novosphingobium sp.]
MTSDVTIAGLIGTQAALADTVLVVIDEDRLCYDGAEARSRRVAAGLIEAGVGRGSRVAMLFGNSVEFAVCFLAITRIGGIAMPLSTMSTPREIRGPLFNADAEYLVSAEAYRGRDLREVVGEAVGSDLSGALLDPAMPVLRRVWFGIGELEAAASDPHVTAAEREVSPADAMVVIHTSGSTSAPKGVTHTHGQVIRNMARQNALRGYTADECLLSNSPWFWIGGLAYSFLATLIAGARLVCSSASPAQMLDLIEAERPTMTNGVAATVLNLAADPSFAAREFSFMRRGNLYPIMPEDVRPADPELRYNMLGMSEAGSVCLFGGHEEDLPEAKRGAFGKPVKGIEARVVDPESGEDAAAGEMWIRGPNVMQGYYGRERHECFDDDGWLHTGDMVSVDADGDFYFKGRTGDIIRTSGAQVSPREVEGAISEAAGGRMSIVIGVADEERGQIVTAVMVGEDPIDEEALRTALRARLSPYKVPRKFLVMRESELPTVSSGKIDLKQLAEIADER